MDQGAQSLILDATILREPVRRALGCDSAEVVSWECHSVHQAVNQVTGGLFRVDGQAVDRGEALPWSIVLKIARNAVHLGRPTDDPSGANYWKREPLLYRSGLLDQLPPGIVVPRCYGVDEPDATSDWIWLEYVDDSSDARWSPRRYGLVARQLGVFNGTYLAQRSLPNDPFLSRSQRWASAAAWSTFFPRISVARELPIVRQTWSTSLQRRVQQISDDSDAFFAALDRLPITFCHLDAFRRNLLIRRRTDGRDETVAIDWAFSGLGPVGAELAPLIGAGLAIGQFAPDQFAEIDASAFAAYVEGLRGSGWDDDPRLARLGFTASAALRYGIIPWWARVVDDQGCAVERLSGESIEEYLERSARFVTLLCGLADEARELIRQAS